MLAAYLILTFLLVVTPGSTTAVVIRNTLKGGRAAGLTAAAGAAVGNTSHATAAGLGLSIALARWPGALGFVRAAGAAYLAWLGLVSLWRAIRPSARNPLNPAPPGARGSFQQGLAVNLLNPAIVTFYLVIVPAFLPAGAPGWYFAALAAIHVAMALGCHSAWVVAFEALRGVFAAPAARRTLEAATGTALIGLAGRILW